MSTIRTTARRRARSLTGRVAAAAFLLVAAATPAAADDVTWSLAPGDTEHGTGRPNFVYAVEPGQELADVLEVTNSSADAVELTVYATDATTTAEGQLDLLPADEAPTGLGTWITLDAGALEAGTLAVPPGATAQVPFTLHVPDDAAPGDHAGGIVTSVLRSTGDGSVVVDQRLALRVHARVAGALQAGLTVTGVDVGAGTTLNPAGTVTTTVTYTLANTGNARLVPTETVTVTRPGGKRVVTEELDELLPGAAITRTVEVAGVRPWGHLTAAVRVDGVVVGLGGGGAATAHGSAGTWALPWPAIAIVALVVAGAVLAGRRRAGVEREGAPAREAA